MTDDQEQQNAIDIAHMQSDIDYLKISVDGIHEKMDKFIEGCDKKYAAKYTEWIVKGMIGVVLLAVAGAIVEMVIKR